MKKVKKYWDDDTIETLGCIVMVVMAIALFVVCLYIAYKVAELTGTTVSHLIDLVGYKAIPNYQPVGWELGCCLVSIVLLALSAIAPQKTVNYIVNKLPELPPEDVGNK